MKSGALPSDAWAACMRRGDFAAAWALSDARRAPITDAEWRKPRHLQRVWDGSDVTGRRVLVRCYHGLGDTIQFARFLPALRSLASEVTVWAQPPLLPLLDGCAGIDRLLALHDGIPDVRADVDVEIMELAYLLRVSADALPRHVPYLRVPAVPRAASGGETAIAIAWRAGTWDPLRSVPLGTACAMFADLPRPDVLLPDVTDVEAACFPAPPPDNSLADAARRIAAANLVISVDTVFAHLAGAMGRPVWVLLPAAADWRWMEGRVDSPWYPTARLFRQSTPGDWMAVATRVREALRSRRHVETRA